jgi:SM-20-related protein
MSRDLEHNDHERELARVWMLPHLVLRDFLDQATVAGLLDYALARQSDFAPTQLVSGAIDPSTRVSTSLRNLGNYRQILKAKILDLVPTLITRLQVTPFQATRIETELVAHGHDAFYKRHIDTQTASQGANEFRVISGVYYFNAEPKAFTGGALRLYAITRKQNENFIDIEPMHNSLLVFPSWAPHEVMPINCPSKRFIDSRFAINCWIYRKNDHSAM